MDYKQIVWLASYPKSGNTWLRCFLEAYFLGEVDINEMIVSLSDDLAFRYLVGDGSDPRDFPLDIQHLTRPMAMLRMVRKYEENKINGVPLFCKTHNAHVVANGIELLPASLTKSVIYIVRDPRDAFISYAKHMGAPHEVAIDWFLDKYRALRANKDAYKMPDFVSSWPLHVQGYANADTHNVRIWRYEDMKADSEKCFTEMLIHSGVTPDKERVKKATELSSLQNLKKQEQDNGFIEASPKNEDKFFGDGKTGGWKGKLDPKIQFRIEKDCASMMKRFGYQREFAKAA